MQKAKGILIQLAAYTLATTIAVLVGREFLGQTGYHLLWGVGAGDLAGTVVIFVFSLIFNNSSLYDPYWSVKPMVIAVLYFCIAGDQLTPRGMLAGGLMILYGLRLTSNFLRDWPGLQKEDWRYVNFRRQFPRLYWVVSFFGIHFFPTVLVWLACVPALEAITEGNSTLNGWDIAGTVVFLGSIVLSFVADEQMRHFRDKPENKGKIMDRKLWSISRHPNYLGEVLGWWGLYFFALGVSEENYLTGIGALAITLLFFFISIPMMDKRSKERRPGFGEYMKRVPGLFPFPLRKK